MRFTFSKRKIVLFFYEIESQCSSVVDETKPIVSPWGKVANRKKGGVFCSRLSSLLPHTYTWPFSFCTSRQWKEKSPETDKHQMERRRTAEVDYCLQYIFIGYLEIRCFIGTLPNPCNYVLERRTNRLRRGEFHFACCSTLETPKDNIRTESLYVHNNTSVSDWNTHFQLYKFSIEKHAFARGRTPERI